LRFDLTFEDDPDDEFNDYDKQSDGENNNNGNKN
jgi:hypothetical protein